MDPQFEYKPARMLAGVLVHGRPKEIDYSDVWMNRYMKFDEFLKPFSIDKAYYGVSFPGGNNGAVDYIAGMVVENLDSVPDGLVLREIPAARFAIFQCTLETIGQTFNQIYGIWLPESQYEFDSASADYEFYPPKTATEGDPVWIYLPIKARQAQLSGL